MVADQDVIRRLVVFQVRGFTILTELVVGQQRDDRRDIVTACPFHPETAVPHVQQSANRRSCLRLQTRHQQVEPGPDIRSGFTGVGVATPQMQA